VDVLALGIALRQGFLPTYITHIVTSFELQVYISTVEAKEYPILGLQWHPEKNSFEWTKHKNIPHGYWASEITHQVCACCMLYSTVLYRNSCITL
jgi:hypothetical protein